MLRPRIVLDSLRTVSAVSSCGQPDARDRADEPTDGREADYPVVTLELRTEIEPRGRTREPLPRHTSHNAPERHGGETEDQREHASVPYKLDHANREPHGRCPQRVVEQLHKSTLPRASAIQDRQQTNSVGGQGSTFTGLIAHSRVTPVTQRNVHATRGDKVPYA